MKYFYTLLFMLAISLCHAQQDKPNLNPQKDEIKLKTGQVIECEILEIKEAEILFLKDSIEKRVSLAIVEYYRHGNSTIEIGEKAQSKLSYRQLVKKDYANRPSVEELNLLRDNYKDEANTLKSTAVFLGVIGGGMLAGSFLITKNKYLKGYIQIGGGIFLLSAVAVELIALNK